MRLASASDLGEYLVLECYGIPSMQELPSQDVRGLWYANVASQIKRCSPCAHHNFSQRRATLKSYLQLASTSDTFHYVIVVVAAAVEQF